MPRGRKPNAVKAAENKKYTPISVIDCIYDEMGFRKMEGAGYEIW